MDWLGLLGAIGGVGGLGWLGEKALRIYRAPVVSVWYDPEETGSIIQTRFQTDATDDGTDSEAHPVRWYHLQVRNSGRGTALGCKATVEKLEVNRNGGWERHPTFVTHIPLVWAHTWERERDITPRDSSPWDRLDFFTIEPGESLIRLVTPFASGKGVQTNFRLKRSYRFTVSVEDSEGRASASTQVTVEPARDAEGELKEPPIVVRSEPA